MPKSALRNGKWEGTVTRVRQNGQRLTTRTTVTPRRDAEGAPIGFLFISKDISDEVRAEKALRRARDKLTGLYNRRYLLELLQQALLAARRYQLPLCVMMLDVDHFKRINDTYGHLLGDYALATLGRLIRENLRANDIASRYGGEEFCIALSHTSLQDARVVAEKLRRLIQAEGIPDDRCGMLHVTCSIGIAAWHPSDATITDLLNRADQTLYEAKAAGRNQVIGPPPIRPADNH